MHVPHVVMDRIPGAFRASERVRNLVWERRLDVSTRGVLDVDHPDSSLYAAMNYASINRTLAALDLALDDVFVDIGCGKGRVLCCAARARVAKVLGVDLSEELCEHARENARRARGLRAPIEVTAGLAEDFDFSECTVYFLFSPFGPGTMRTVLRKIRADREGRPVRIAYANAAFPEPFAEQPWLEEEDFRERVHPHEEHSVAFYRGVA